MNPTTNPQWVLNTRGRLRLNLDSPTPQEGLKYYQYKISQDLGLISTLKAFYHEGIFDSLFKLLEDPALNLNLIPENHLKLFQTMGILIPYDELAHPVRCTVSLQPSDEIPELKLPSDLLVNPFVWIQKENNIPPGQQDNYIYHHHFEHTPPIIWIHDPLRHMSFPYQADFKLVEALESNQWDTLPEAQQKVLYLSEILVSQHAHTQRLDQIPNTKNTFQAQLYKKGYLKLKEVLPSWFLTQIQAYIQALHQEGYFQVGDEQVQLRDIVHNEPVMEFILYQMGRYLNSFLLAPIKPSYTFLCHYKPGAVLKRHRDREQCAWNVSLVMDSEPKRAGDEVWPFFIETDQIQKIMLDMGDAILYQGTQLFHWREALPAHEQVRVCLFHFVPEGFKGSLN